MLWMYRLASQRVKVWSCQILSLGIWLVGKSRAHGNFPFPSPESRRAD